MTDKEIVIAAAEAMGWEVMTVVQYRRMRGIAHADTVVEMDGALYRRDERDAFVLAWNPLISISDAWMLVEALKSRFRRIEVHVTPDGIACQIADGTSDTDERYIASSESDSAPRAITLAALKALGEGKA